MWLTRVFSYLQLLNENVNERSPWISHELSTLFFYSDFLFNCQGVSAVGQVLERGQLNIIIIVSMGVSYHQLLNCF